MARIYYYEKKRIGQSIQDDFVTSELLDYIFENSSVYQFDFQETKQSSFLGLIKKENFKTVYLSKDDIFFSNEGIDYYLPNAIIFYDEDDYNFPSEFYFIAQINNEIELRKCNGGKDVEWFHFPKLHQPVTDPKIFKKIKNTLQKVKELVDTTHNKRDILEAEPKQEENRPYVSDTEKKAYQKLADLCMNDKAKKAQFIEFTETLKDYQDDEEYYTTLNFVIEFLEDNDINFIMRMDYKVEPEDLEWLVQKVLDENYKNANITLPTNYDEDSCVYEDGIFEDYNDVLEKSGLQLSFIDTESDEYIAIIHKINDIEEIEKAISEIGYKSY